ncbi:hypothetical protein DVT68_13205 [Dyella solisilvae]|uniref:Uncharacterized protein n=1 Tax=Dyella solisilvae TaxID=1920168 RepID=A0A370K6E6_9GAMM|nr:hypothetical protein DVT68_13205 [Dyella solisilvae]
MRDWIHLQVEILTDLYYPTFRVRAGAKGRVVRTPRGGSGLVVRLSSGHEVRQLTEAHVRVIGSTQGYTEP